MIIEGRDFYDIEMFVSESGSLHCLQRNDAIDGNDKLIIDKQQATQLIEVLTKWVNGVEVE